MVIAAPHYDILNSMSYNGSVQKSGRNQFRGTERKPNGETPYLPLSNIGNRKIHSKEKIYVYMDMNSYEIDRLLYQKQIRLYQRIDDLINKQFDTLEADKLAVLTRTMKIQKEVFSFMRRDYRMANYLEYHTIEIENKGNQRGYR